MASKSFASLRFRPIQAKNRSTTQRRGTVAPVLDPGRGRTKKGYFWAIARDDRPWGGTDPPAVAYTYAPGRGAVHALKLLETYRGIVQCDGYAAYNGGVYDNCRVGRYLASNIKL